MLDSDLTIICLTLLLSFALALRGRWYPSPNVPPVVSTFLPWVGGAIGYGRDSMKYLKQCQELYGPAFRLLLAGKRIMFICDVQGINSLFRDKRKVFGTHTVHFQMLQAVGGVKRAFDVVHLMDQRLFPIVGKAFSREGVDTIAPPFNEDILRRIDVVADRVRGNPGGTRIPLAAFVGENIYCAISMAVFGSLYPFQSYSDFDTLDEDILLLLSPVPFMGRKALQAQERLVRAIGDYVVRAWHDGQLHGASKMASEMVSVLKDTDYSERDMNASLLTFMWGMHSNTIRITYWALVFLLNDKTASKMISEEVDTGLRDHFEGDLRNLLAAPPSSLETLFPLLDSAIKETLRLAVLLSALREADADTKVISDAGELRIRRGDLVMANLSAVHKDDRNFENADQFRVDRFVGNEKARLAPWAFGGGTHLCKGRFLAMHVMRVFVILCFRRFEMKLVDASGKTVEGKLPPPDPRNLGVIRPSMEFYLDLKIREF